MNCLHCTAETSNGLALCDLCQRKAADCLESVPVYFRNLARWRRPGRPNGAIGAAGQWLIRQGESDTEHVGRALDKAGNDLTTWARSLSEDRGIETPGGDTESDTIAAVCEWLTEHLTSIATLEWAGQFVRDIDRHERALRGLTETVVPGWYAGGCKRCGSGTYVVPGLMWVTCSACGVTTFARDHLDAVLDEARTWVAPPRRIAETLVALLDTEQSIDRLHDRIRQWSHRGDLRAIRRIDPDGDEVGIKRYRLGQVLDRLVSEGETRPKQDGAAEPAAAC